MTTENALPATSENALASAAAPKKLTSPNSAAKSIPNPTEKSTETDIAAPDAPAPKQKQADIRAAIAALKRQIRLNEIANDGYYLSWQRKEDEAALAEWTRRLQECETET